MSVGPTPLEIFRAKGVPHRRMEDWKYTDVRAALETLEGKSEGFAGFNVSGRGPVKMVDAVDGRLPTWVSARLANLADFGVMDVAARSHIGLGSVHRVPAGNRSNLSIEHLEAGHGTIAVFVDAGASVAIEVRYATLAAGMSNTSLIMFLDEGASVDLTVTERFEAESVLVSTVSVLQAKNSHFVARVFTGGAKLSRTEFNIVLNGEGAGADLSGVSVLGDKAHADITTRIDHAVPNTTSRQLFKKVAGGKSRAVYQGKIIVREGAVHSDSRQTAKALLLSNHAEADLKPELEILADDVKCAHGAAVGDLDADSLFYLRSRGIPEGEARALLVHAFLQEVVDGIENEGLRGAAVEFIDSGLAWAMEGQS
jgi:Fe-S cluster assembly protein SufD